MTQSASSDSRGLQAAPIRAKDSGARTTITIFALLALAALALLGVRTFLFQPFSIPSGSLVPSLLIGDYVLVSKYSYGYSHFSLPAFLDRWPDAMKGRLLAAAPRRGDVVVFKLPRDGQTDYIKRVIGLPGDKIQMIRGRLFINGTIVERTPLPPYATQDQSGQPIAAPHYRETLPGGAGYEIIQVEGDDGLFANTPLFEVPAGNYFMLGDNRDNSLDSRIPAEKQGVGFVPFENLIGRAEIIFYSVASGEQADDSAAWLRWRRMFQPVR
jgi:signal peptidase I